MKNRGFTLAELMGVIVILAVLALLAIPVIDRTIQENKEESYRMQLENMKTGLKNWAIGNPQSLPDEHNETVTLTLAQLKQGAYVKIDIRNPKTGKLFPNDMLLTITNYNGSYLYEVVENSGTPTNVDYNPSAPIILLKGKALEYIDIHGTYQDPGVEAKNALGEAIASDQIVTKMYAKKTPTSADYVPLSSPTVRAEDASHSYPIAVSQIYTNEPNEYQIVYSVTVDGVTTTVWRNVIVKDVTPPTLTIPKNISVLASAVNGLQLMSGVEVTDNSGETITPTVSGYVSDIPGKYTLVYTATDSSGNTTSKIRVITVQDTNAYQQLTSNVVVSGSGLYKTSDGEYRYRGASNVNNYIRIDGKDYRIIGIDEQGIKVITVNPLASLLPFDSTTGTTRNNANNTYCQVTSGTYNGCNVYAKVTGTFTNGSKTGTITQNSSLYTYLNSSGTEAELSALRTIALTNIDWNIGVIEPVANKTVDQVRKEEAAYQATFLIGLMNTSDYILASLDTSCQTTGINYSVNCKNNNWLFSSVQYPWTLNGYNGNTSGTWTIHSTDGNLIANNAGDANSVRPVAYLSSSMKIIGGSGTSSDPYQMEMPE